jgi:hypothetical protein
MLRCARLTMIVFAFLDICGLASHGQSTTVASQASTQLTSRDPAPRQIVRGRGFVNDPIKIVDILYDGKPVMGSRPFDAPDDWLSHVDVIVKNASSKPLVAGNFQLTFDGVGGERPLTHYIRFGAIPGHALQMPSGVTRDQPIGEQSKDPIPPGGTVTLSLKDFYPPLRARLLAATSLSNVTECTIDYGVYWFDGGLLWAPGNYSIEDPSQPGKYIPSPRENLVKVP